MFYLTYGVIEGSFIMKNIAIAKAEKKSMSTIDKCFMALFISVIILITTFVAAFLCLHFGISIFGNPILTCHTLLVGGLMIEIGILICCAIVMLLYK